MKKKLAFNINCLYLDDSLKLNYMIQVQLKQSRVKGRLEGQLVILADDVEVFTLELSSPEISRIAKDVKNSGLAFQVTARLGKKTD